MKNIINQFVIDTKDGIKKLRNEFVEVADEVYSLRESESVKESSDFLLKGIVLFPIAIFVGAIIHSFIHFLTWR